MDATQQQLQDDFKALKDAVALVAPVLTSLQAQLKTALANQPDDAALQAMDDEVKEATAGLVATLAPVSDPTVAKSAAKLTTFDALAPSKHPTRRG